MKKIFIIIIVIGIVTCTSHGQSSIVKTEKQKQDSISNVNTKSSSIVNITETFDQGKVQLKFEGIENGKYLEITILNLTNTLLSLFIAEGITKFSEYISINLTKELYIDIPANENKKVKVGQEPGGLISGSVTMKKNPTK